MKNSEERETMFSAIERFGRHEYSRGYRAGRELAEAQAQVEFDLQIPTSVSLTIGMLCGAVASLVARLIWGAWT